MKVAISNGSPPLFIGMFLMLFASTSSDTMSVFVIPGDTCGFTIGVVSNRTVHRLAYHFCFFCKVKQLVRDELMNCEQKQGSAGYNTNIRMSATLIFEGRGVGWVVGGSGLPS